MFAASLLALREGIEIALVIGIALSTLRQMDRPELRSALWGGLVSAAALSLIIAIILNRVGAEFEGQGEQIFEGSAMLLAAGLLTWMIFWMRRSKAGTRSVIAAEVRASSERGKLQLFILAFTSVLRDGIELALFLIAAQFSLAPLQTLTGAFLGLALAALIGWGLFTSTLKMDIRRFFLITNIFLIFFAAGLVGRGIHEWNEAGLLPTVFSPLWNLTSLVSEDSGVGQILTVLFGYSSSPSLTMALGYLGYLIVMGTLLFGQFKPKTPTLSKA